MLFRGRLCKEKQDKVRDAVFEVCSFHNFGRKNVTDKSKNDFIFVSQGIKVKECTIPQEEPVNGVYLSDHNPVVSILQMK